MQYWMKRTAGLFEMCSGQGGTNKHRTCPRHFASALVEMDGLLIHPVAAIGEIGADQLGSKVPHPQKVAPSRLDPL